LTWEEYITKFFFQLRSQKINFYVCLMIVSTTLLW